MCPPAAEELPLRPRRWYRALMVAWLRLEHRVELAATRADVSRARQAADRLERATRRAQARLEGAGRRLVLARRRAGCSQTCRIPSEWHSPHSPDYICCYSAHEALLELLTRDAVTVRRFIQLAEQGGRAAGMLGCIF
jgi:hypothetical protein